MTVCLVFLLEEPSAMDFLEQLVPRLLPESVEVRYLVFEGKQDLEKRMVRRIRGWLRPDSRFLVMRDQDSGDCHEIKAALQERCTRAGRPDAVVRIACRELESFFLGDWTAVAMAFDEPKLELLGRRARYRDPDRLANPAEELRRHLGSYQKRDGARRIAPQLRVDENRSRSSRTLVAAVRRLAEA